MFSMTRTLVRVGVIGVLAVGGLAVIAGPERIGALFSEAKGSMNASLDKLISDPVALRAQLRDLEAQYPQRIAAVRSDLAEVRGQVQQLKRERSVAERVVDLTAKDVETLQTMLARAEEARGAAGITNVSYGEGVQQRVELVFSDQRLSVEQAYAKTAEINNTRNAYAARIADVDRDMGYLASQEQRLTALLTKLENEQSQFQVQLWQLDRQVDSIARNDRMIDILSKRQEAIDEASRYKVASLDHLQTRIADLRAKQESKLAGLTTAAERTDYESRAKIELDAKTAATSLQEAARATKTSARKAEVIEIRPHGAETVGPPAPTTPPSSLAGRAN
jgi:predicted RNase H-like nuclease (RuvC/YqgF family)